MPTIVLSDPEVDFKEHTLKAVIPSPSKLLLYINDKLALDYDGTSTMYDEWHALEYNDKCYDLHIYFCEPEYPETNGVILYALEEVDGNLQTDHNTYLKIPIEFGFDVNTFFED